MRGVRTVEAALGTGVKVPTAAEREVARVARKSLHWRTSVPRGAVVAAEHLIALRPGWGGASTLAPARGGGSTLREPSREGTLLA